MSGPPTIYPNPVTINPDNILVPDRCIPNTINPLRTFALFAESMRGNTTSTLDAVELGCRILRS